MHLNSAIHDQTHVITVNGSRIDAACAIQFKDEMRAATETGPDQILLDLSGVDFVDSSGLGAVVASLKQLRGGRKLDLAGLSPDVAKVFRLTRMDSIFVIHETVEDALQRAAS